MKNRNAFFYIIMILALLAVAGLIFVLLPGNDPDTPAVFLPTPAPADTASGAVDAAEGTEVLAVSPETVQTVIGTLHRCESYSRTLNVRDFWSGGSRSRTITVWVHGENLRLTEQTEGSGTQKHLLLRGSTKWIWYSDSPDVYRGQASGSDADADQSIISYEKVLSLPVSDILEAGYEDYSGIPCILVRFRSGALGYVSECYIDPATGLLMGERCYDGETLIYSMDSGLPEISTPDDSVFAAPD